MNEEMSERQFVEYVECGREVQLLRLKIKQLQEENEWLYAEIEAFICRMRQLLSQWK